MHYFPAFFAVRHTDTVLVNDIQKEVPIEGVLFHLCLFSFFMFVFICLKNRFHTWIKQSFWDHAKIANQEDKWICEIETSWSTYIRLGYPNLDMILKKKTKLLVFESPCLYKFLFLSALRISNLYKSMF